MDSSKNKYFDISQLGDDNNEVNKLMKKQFGVDSMPETAENVAEMFQIRREDQDSFAFRSQQRAGVAQKNGAFAKEITPVHIPQRKGDPLIVDQDEHPRPDTTVDGLSKLSTPFREGGTVTAGNAAGVNDGACALLIASDVAVKKYGLTPRARLLTMATAGVEPRIMGMGPAPASRKALARCNLSVDDFDIIELNEAIDSKDSKEVIKRKKQIKFLLEESINAL